MTYWFDVQAHAQQVSFNAIQANVFLRPGSATLTMIVRMDLTKLAQHVQVNPQIIFLFSLHPQPHSSFHFRKNNLCLQRGKICRNRQMRFAHFIWHIDCGTSILLRYSIHTWSERYLFNFKYININMGLRKTRQELLSMGLIRVMHL